MNYRKVHHLKTWPDYFAAVRRGSKTFEVRTNDRDFQVGDLLVLQEYDPQHGVFSGEEECRVITYITDWGQTAGQVVLGITPETSRQLETELAQAKQELTAEKQAYAGALEHWLSQHESDMKELSAMTELAKGLANVLSELDAYEVCLSEQYPSVEEALTLAREKGLI